MVITERLGALLAGCVLCCLGCLGCRTEPARHPCLIAQDAIAAADEAEGDRLIDSGACDKFADVMQCPAYQAHRAKFDALAASLKACKP